MKNLNEIKGLLIDLEGVIYSGDQIIKGAIETIARLKDKFKIRYITNTTTTSRNLIFQNLKSLNLPVNENDIFSPSIAVNYFLKDKYSVDYKEFFEYLISNSLNKFSRESIARLWESTYTISSNSNRIGYRLNGPSINHNGGADIISSGTEFGAIQIPGNGQPIILMADRGTTGGYSKIGSVITPDISKLAQAAPNNKINFRPVSLHEAHQISFKYERVMKSLASTVSGLDNNIRVIYDNKDFEIHKVSGGEITDPNKIKEHSDIESQKYSVEYNGETYSLAIETYR